jgi:uncharacterized protein
MFFFRFIFAAAMVAGAAMAMQPDPALAQGAQIETAKANGIVGERIDGYLGFVNDGAADASLRRRIQEINVKRRAAYEEIARETGATVVQVARVTGEKQIGRARPGEFFMNEQGKWVRK